jgi:hypothetical protein
MPYENDRTEFVQDEYRYVEAVNQAVKDRNPEAREITIDTQLNKALATIRANAELTGQTAPRYFEIKLEGVLHLDSLVGGPPAWTLVAPTYHVDDREFRTVGFTTDYKANRVVVKVRG